MPPMGRLCRRMKQTKQKWHVDEVLLVRAIHRLHFDQHSQEIPVFQPSIASKDFSQASTSGHAGSRKVAAARAGLAVTDLS